MTSCRRSLLVDKTKAPLVRGLFGLVLALASASARPLAQTAPVEIAEIGGTQANSLVPLATFDGQRWNRLGVAPIGSEWRLQQQGAPNRRVRVVGEHAEVCYSGTRPIFRTDAPSLGENAWWSALATRGQVRVEFARDVARGSAIWTKARQAVVAGFGELEAGNRPQDTVSGPRFDRRGFGSRAIKLLKVQTAGGPASGPWLFHAMREYVDPHLLQPSEQPAVSVSGWLLPTSDGRMRIVAAHVAFSDAESGGADYAITRAAIARLTLQDGNHVWVVAHGEYEAGKTLIVAVSASGQTVLVEGLSGCGL